MSLLKAHTDSILTFWWIKFFGSNQRFGCIYRVERTKATGFKCPVRKLDQNKDFYTHISYPLSSLHHKLNKILRTRRSHYSLWHYVYFKWWILLTNLNLGFKVGEPSKKAVEIISKFSSKKRRIHRDASIAQGTQFTAPFLWDAIGCIRHQHPQGPDLGGLWRDRPIGKQESKRPSSIVHVLGLPHSETEFFKYVSSFQQTEQACL